MGPYKIDKGIPAPSGRSHKYPFSGMEVGDSFAYQAEDHRKVLASVHAYARRFGQKFKVSKHHLRCWRLG